MYTNQQLNSMKVSELNKIAREMGIKSVKSYKKAELIKLIYETQVQGKEEKPKAKAEEVKPKTPKNKKVNTTNKPVFHRPGKRSFVTFK